MAATSPRVDQRHQLTQRRIVDCCIRMQHTTVEWSELNTQGLDAANELVRLTLERLHPTSHVNSHADKIKNLGKLTSMVKKMEVVVTKMGGLARNLHGSAELLAMEKSTIPVALLAQNAEDIFQAYCEELQLKQSILEDLLHQKNSDTLTVYLSCWLHEPCLTDTVKDKLQTLILHAVN